MSIKERGITTCTKHKRERRGRKSEEKKKKKKMEVSLSSTSCIPLSAKLKHKHALFHSQFPTSTASTKTRRTKPLFIVNASRPTLSSNWLVSPHDLSATTSSAWLPRIEELDTTNMLLRQRIIFLGSQVLYLRIKYLGWILLFHRVMNTLCLSDYVFKGNFWTCSCGFIPKDAHNNISMNKQERDSVNLTW